MKSIFTIACLFIVTTFCLAQAPQAFNYSAVVRNGSGTPIPNQLVKFRLSILRGTITGPSVYVETHSTTTDGNGMVNLEIGRGTIVSGVFATIPWNNDAFFFQVEVDPTGGNTFQLMGTTQFLSVPYALNAKYAENVAAQFGLFTTVDTIHLFRGDSTFYGNASGANLISGPYSVNIKWFGGTQEDFTYLLNNIPSGLTFITPTTKTYNKSVLGTAADFSIPQSLYVSNTMTPGFYTITYSVTTASNRIVKKDFVIHILNDCALVNELLGKRGVFSLLAPSASSCFGVRDTVTFVANTSNPTCGITLQFTNGNKLNLDINKRNLIINSTQFIGNFTSNQLSYVNTYQNVTLNATSVLKNTTGSILTASPIYSWTNNNTIQSYGPFFSYPINASGTNTTTNPFMAACVGTFSTTDVYIQTIR